MKRILYNNAVKFTAVILCGLCIAACVQLFSSNFLHYNFVYLLENSYEDSYMAGNELGEEFYSLLYQLEATQTADESSETATDAGKLKLHPEKLRNLPAADEWEYYIKVNDKIYTNVKNANYSYFKLSKLAFGIQNYKDGAQDCFRNGASNYSYWFIDTDENYEICVKMPDKLVEENSMTWENMKAQADGALKVIVTLLIVFAALVIYLMIVCGRCGRKDDKIQLMLIDRMWVEITLFLFLVSSIGGIMLTVGGVMVVFDEHLTIAYPLMSILAFVVVTISLAFFLSLIRNIKNRTFLEKSLIVKIFKWLYRAFKKICARIKRFFSQFKSTLLATSASHFGGKYIGIIIVGLAICVCILTLITLAAPIMVLALGGFVIWIVIAASKRVTGLEKVKDGIEKIKNGDLEHKIEGCPEGFVGKMAEDINSIGDGLQKSLEREIKAERMKSELITNVSHDLKTPLTSIINYADLLSKEHLTPEEANDYAAIIAKKSERLKQLTEDLFDVSKAQSGNEEFNIEELDLCLLINQALAERNETIEKSGLSFKFAQIEDSILVKADGKKMSRVFENLFENCIKYAMKNTRVYIDVEDGENEVKVEVKNIAGYEMEFDEDEITERFVRGDSSRSSEGSGLGLAIVKSYVEGCGGSVKIKKDGDLFKVTISLKKV